MKSTNKHDNVDIKLWKVKLLTDYSVYTSPTVMEGSGGGAAAPAKPSSNLKPNYVLKFTLAGHTKVHCSALVS